MSDFERDRESDRESTSHKRAREDYISDQERDSPKRSLQPEDEEPERQPSPKKPKLEFDQVLDSLKAGRRRPRKKKDDDGKASHKPQVEVFIDNLREAYRADREAIQNRKPATSKLKMIPELMETTNKLYLQGLLIQEGLLKVLGKWIEFLPDGSLPNMNVRSAVLKVLEKLPVVGESNLLIGRTDDFKGMEKSQLGEAGLGRLVLSLYRHKDETIENKKLAQKLIERWSRLLFGLTRDYRKLHERQDEEEEEYPRHQARRSTSEEDSHVAKPGEPGFSYRARVPRVDGFDFKILPKSKVIVHQERRQANPDEAEEDNNHDNDGNEVRPSRRRDETHTGVNDRIKSKLQEMRKPSNSKKASRAVRVSIEGNRMLH